jgi:hypothetical protein
VLAALCGDVMWCTLIDCTVQTLLQFDGDFLSAGRDEITGKSTVDDGSTLVFALIRPFSGQEIPFNTAGLSFSVSLSHCVVLCCVVLLIFRNANEDEKSVLSAGLSKRSEVRDESANDPGKEGQSRAGQGWLLQGRHDLR